MLTLTSLTADPFQEHSVNYNGENITLIFRFYPNIEAWTADIKYKNIATKGVRLVLGAQLLKSKNCYPFDLLITDTSNLGIDPFKCDDLTERVRINILTQEEL